MVGSPTRRRFLGGRSGQTILLTAFLLLASLIIAGLAIDLGRYYVVRTRLASAVDGGALAGARVLTRGVAFAELAARNFAGMNFRNGYMGTTAHSFSVSVDLNPDAPRIVVYGDAVMPTTLMRLVGIDHVNVGTEAEATRRPFAGPLVLDTSRSMMNGDAIHYLRAGAIDFVEYFNDEVDQMALVRYASGRVVPFSLGHHFKGAITSAIAGFSASGATTAEDALAAGAAEVQDAQASAFKALVFFTDGRPTSFRDNFLVEGEWYDGVIGGYPDPFEDVYPPAWPPYGLFDPLQVDGTLGVPNPPTLPSGAEATTWNILIEARSQTRAAASSARANGITIYAIGLGDPEEDEWNRPDAALLIELANIPSAPDPFGPGTIVNPSYDPSQPRGAFYFTPDPAELEDIFERIAREISIRLTR
jgi:Flp pilus assembly protein TadG